MTLPNKFTFNHTKYPNDIRTVELVDGAYKEQPSSPDGMGSLWPVKEVKRFFDPQVNLWENMKAVTTLKDGPFHHRDGENYQGKVVGDKYVVTWEETETWGPAGSAEYDLDVPEGLFAEGTWIMGEKTVVAAPVPSFVEQLVSVAAAQCYCFTVFPDGAVTLQDLGEDDPRVIDLKDAETALKWFDLKAQLGVLED